MLFIGHTRFSLFNPNSPSWRASNNSRFKTVDEYKAHLYSDERLDVRCEIFLNHSMPQLALAAEKVRLRHIVSYSESLPQKYKDILQGAVKRFPFLIMEERAQSRALLDKDDLARELALPGEAFGVYRLDDDDLLPVNYFEQVAPYVTPANAGFQVTLPIGASALYVDGEYRNVRKPYWSMLAIGLLDVCRIELDGTVLKPKNAPHHLSDRTNPVIADGRGIGWMWLRHASQDTALDHGGADDPETMARVVAQMNKYPEFTDIKALAEAFPVIRERLSHSTTK